MHEGGRKCLQRYIGESSRPLRMRAKEYFNKLESFKTDSFMLIHWMEVHGDSIIPPNFKIERVASYDDTFRRQISEALLIETEGTLNKRQEYGCNTLFRLASRIAD